MNIGFGAYDGFASLKFQPNPQPVVPVISDLAAFEKLTTWERVKTGLILGAGLFGAYFLYSVLTSMAKPIGSGPTAFRISEPEQELLDKAKAAIIPMTALSYAPFALELGLGRDIPLKGYVPIAVGIFYIYKLFPYFIAAEAAF